MKKASLLFLLNFLCFGMFGSYSQNRTTPLPKHDMEIASQNYQRYCALCHGVDREGNAADFAPSLRSKSLLSTMHINFLASTISYGRPNTAMAGYMSDIGGPLYMKDIYNLAVWLQYKSGHKTITLREEPISGNLNNGSIIYQQKCIECHGEKGEGITAPALANPALLAFASDSYLKHAISNGREETKMQAYSNILTENQINDITSYIRSLTSGWSPEPKELTPIPETKNYVLHPKGENPSFELINGRYAPMEQVLEAIRTKKRMVILDTRTTSEWHNAHIPGAIPIPYYISKSKVSKGLPKDDTWIIAYCSCPHAASDKIINMLRDKGFKNTAVINEGFFKWINAEYPVMAGQDKK